MGKVETRLPARGTKIPPKVTKPPRGDGEVQLQSGGETELDGLARPGFSPDLAKLYCCLP